MPQNGEVMPGKYMFLVWILFQRVYIKENKFIVIREYFRFYKILFFSYQHLQKICKEIFEKCLVNKGLSLNEKWVTKIFFKKVPYLPSY